MGLYRDGGAGVPLLTQGLGWGQGLRLLGSVPLRGPFRVGHVDQPDHGGCTERGGTGCHYETHASLPRMHLGRAAFAVRAV